MIALRCAACSHAETYVADDAPPARRWHRGTSDICPACAPDYDEPAPVTLDPVGDAIAERLIEEEDDEADLDAYTARIDYEPDHEEGELFLEALAEARRKAHDERVREDRREAPHDFLPEWEMAVVA